MKRFALLTALAAASLTLSTTAYAQDYEDLDGDSKDDVVVGHVEHHAEGLFVLHARVEDDLAALRRDRVVPEQGPARRRRGGEHEQHSGKPTHRFSIAQAVDSTRRAATPPFGSSRCSDSEPRVS